MDLRAIQCDPAAFRDALLIDADAGPRRFGPNLDPWQRDDFAAIDSGLRRAAGQAVENPTLRAMFIRPRGHSKTSDQSVTAAWLLFASRRKLSGVAAAADKDQALLLLNAIDTLCRLNGWLGEILEVGRDRVTNRHTGSCMVVISSDAASSFGHNPDFVILDELSHWRGRELFDSLLSASAKRANCMLLAILNAGFRESWQGELVNQIRTDPAWIFTSWTARLHHGSHLTDLKSNADYCRRKFLPVCGKTSGPMVQAMLLKAATLQEPSRSPVRSRRQSVAGHTVPG
ncbi:MAG: hypothetical protein H0T51_15425 [Pirellulales bacterium]|nr:hypothetical protein [Pirellulales bacterium]